MKTSVTLLAVVTLMAFVGVAKAQQAQLTLSVFYESLCPDSIRFITRQLHPTFTSLGGIGNPYLAVDYVPYGKANTTEVNGTYTFVCQHGDAECEGNKMQACALALYPSYIRSAFINCSMSASYPPNAGPECAQQLLLNWNPLEDCWHGEAKRGAALLAANGVRTHALEPTLYYVPWILYNGVFTVEDLNNSQANLMDTVCKKLEDPKPAVCN